MEGAYMGKGKKTFLKCLLMLPVCTVICLAGAGAINAEPAKVAAASGGVSLRPLWAVSGYFIGQNATWGEQEAKGLLFKSLDISRDSITFDGQVCKGVQFQKETVASTDYLRNVWQVTSKDLGIKDGEIQVVNTNCTIIGFQEYLRLSDNRLLVLINGVFFKFEPLLAR
jgi:hypothetical protein